MSAEDYGWPGRAIGMPTAPKRAIVEPVRPKRAENLLAEVLGAPAPSRAMPRRAR